jgi:Tfp pilus assembly protein PilF
MVPHYLRALVAVRGGRDEEAEREFKAAMFSRNGFTRVNVEYARLMLRQKRYKEAYDILEDALTGPLDAMLRYQPRFEILALMDTVKMRAP